MQQAIQRQDFSGTAPERCPFDNSEMEPELCTLNGEFVSYIALQVITYGAQQSYQVDVVTLTADLKDHWNMDNTYSNEFLAMRRALQLSSLYGSEIRRSDVTGQAVA